jgi:hypothetical protein
MKYINLFLIAINISISGLCQINFEKGYFINNENGKTECFIKNIDGITNPTDFKYTMTKNAEVLRANIKDVKEFCINNSVKFIRADIDIDTSSCLLNELSYERNPLWAHKRLFLKVLIEGKASLFFYTDGKIERFFYLISDKVIKQLVFKEYFYNSDQTAFNQYFKQQLLNDLKCSGVNNGSVSNLYYTKKDLLQYFDRYNQCADTTYKRITPQKQHSNKFQLLISTGLDCSTLSIKNEVSTYKNTDFGNNLNVRFGAGVEYTLPFNKNKWGISIESNYQSFKAQKQTDYSSYYSTYSNIEFKSIDFSLGLKYYFFLNKSKVFIDVFLNSLPRLPILFKLETWTSATGKEYLESKAFVSNHYLSIGGGFKYKRFYIETRYYFTSNIFAKNPTWFSEYKKLSLLLGCRLF